MATSTTPTSPGRAPLHSRAPGQPPALTIQVDLLERLVATAVHQTEMNDPITRRPIGPDMRVRWECTADCPRCAAEALLHRAALHPLPAGDPR